MKAKPKVNVYTTTACPWCHVAKDFLRQHKIAFDEYDVGESEEAAKQMIEKSGQMGVPVIEINGQIIVGFDEAALKRLLGIK